MKEYIYFWYHHGMPMSDRLAIQNAIDAHDFDKFCKYYKKYELIGWENAKMHVEENGKRWFAPLNYFPSHISIWENTEPIGTLSIWEEEDFKKITSNECECG